MEQAEQAFLASIGLPGWVVRSRAPHMVKDPNPLPGGPVESKADGNVTWVIVGPKGERDTMVVAPGSTGGTSANYTYTAIELPKNIPDPVKTLVTPVTANEKNEAALNDERSWNAANTKWGRVTHAEAAALDAKEAAAGRQLTNDERNAALAASRENRAIATDERVAANQAASNDIARARLDLDRQNAARGDIKTVETDQGTQLVETKPDGTFAILHTFPPGIKTTTAQDGTILAIDPANPSKPPTIIWSPVKPPSMVPGQSVNQPNFLFTDPKTGELTTQANPIAGQGPPSEVTGQQGPTILQKMPDGTYRTVPNPAYQSKFQQALNDYQGGISAIESQLATGAISLDDANTYKGALRQNFDAALQGTTPYQQQQDKQRREQERLTAGRDLLNQRVAAGSGLAQSLLSQAVGIAGNKNFMDPSAVAGFSPFAGAADYVTGLGGGQDIYSAAASAVKAGLGDDPASALINAAMNGGGAPQGAGPGAAPAPAMPVDTGVLPPGMAGTVPSGDPRFMGSGSTGGIDPRLLAQDPGAALLAAALGRNAQQLTLTGPAQRGPLFG